MKYVKTFERFNSNIKYTIDLFNAIPTYFWEALELENETPESFHKMVEDFEEKMDSEIKIIKQKRLFNDEEIEKLLIAYDYAINMCDYYTRGMFSEAIDDLIDVGLDMGLNIKIFDK